MALLPSLLRELRHRQPVVREGFAQLFVHMPEAFGPRFACFLEEALPAVLDSESLARIARTSRAPDAH